MDFAEYNEQGSQIENKWSKTYLKLGSKCSNFRKVTRHSRKTFKYWILEMQTSLLRSYK